MREEFEFEKFARKQQEFIDSITSNLNPFLEQQRQLEAFQRTVVASPMELYNQTNKAQALQDSFLVNSLRQNWGDPLTETIRQAEELSRSLQPPVMADALRMESLLKEIRPAIPNYPLTYGNLLYNIENEIDFDESYLYGVADVDEDEIEACYDLLKSASLLIEDEQLDEERKNQISAAFTTFGSSVEALIKKGWTACRLLAIKHGMDLAQVALETLPIIIDFPPEQAKLVSATALLISILDKFAPKQKSDTQNRDNVLEKDFAASENGLPEGIDKNDINFVDLVVNEDEDKK